MDADTVVRIYGIKQCSTMKKAFDWLDAHGIRYEFHDYKKLGIDANTLAGWADKVGWQVLLNTRGTTWRGLADHDRDGVDGPRALALMQDKPSLIKRPVIVSGTDILVGFDTDAFAATLEP